MLRVHACHQSYHYIQATCLLIHPSDALQFHLPCSSAAIDTLFTHGIPATVCCDDCRPLPLFCTRRPYYCLPSAQRVSATARQRVIIHSCSYWSARRRYQGPPTALFQHHRLGRKRYALDNHNPLPTILCFHFSADAHD